MRKHQVSSLPIHKVIQDIARAFDTNYSNECDYYTVELPKDVGSGTIEGINFGHGFGVIHYRCIFNEETIFKFDLTEVHPLKFLFCYRGMLEHRFEEDSVVQTIDSLQNTIVASENQDGHQLHFEANKPIHVFSLEISRKDYNKTMNCELSSLSKATETLFRDEHAKAKFIYSGYYSLKTSFLIKDINTNLDTGFLRKLFFQSKALQFLNEQIKILNNQDNDKEQQRLFGTYEIKQIAEVGKLIQNNLSTAYTIEKLSEKVGMNKNKLQKGFKLLYGKTINEFVQSERTIKAAELLSSSSLNISEITEQLGIKSKSYFSKTFKKEFGITPQKFQINAKNLVSE